MLRAQVLIFNRIRWMMSIQLGQSFEQLSMVAGRKNKTKHRLGASVKVTLLKYG